MRGNVFALVDCNNFYCSCERLFRPDLKNHPVAVLSNNDGCVVARSQEVKDLGIKMGTPVFKVKDLIAQHNIQIFSSNYTLYGDLSDRVMQTLEGFTPDVEIYSIDEAFLDLSGFADPLTYSKTIKKRVDRDVGVPVSIGLGPTKTLAKLANHAAKKIFQNVGIADFTDPIWRKKIMKDIAIEAIWGIGASHTQKLKRLGITTALQLAQMHPKEGRTRFSVNIERTIRELNGTPCINLDHVTPPKKQIVCSRSFGDKISEYNPLRQTICEFICRAAEKLRKEKQLASSLTVFIRTSPFDRHEPYYSNTVTGKLLQASSDSRILLKHTTRLFDEIWKEGHRYAKAGVMLGDFSNEAMIQLLLMEERTDSIASDHLMQTMDKINNTVGSIWFGGQRPTKDWFMKQANRSPAYTTRWNSLPVVR